MNKIILIGNTTREVEVRYSQGANPIAVARVGLATRREFAKQGEQQADFFNLVAFGKTAEIMEKYVTKGTKIGIVGHVQVNTYEDQDKKKRTSFDIVVDSLELLGRKETVTPGETPGETPGFNIPTEDEDDLPF